MELPSKYTIICQLTGEITETNTAPLLHQLQTYVQTDVPNVKQLRQTKIVYEDTRYKAKLRLYNYLRKKAGLNTWPAKYEPFKGTEIGKTQPILNF